MDVVGVLLDVLRFFSLLLFGFVFGFLCNPALGR